MMSNSVKKSLQLQFVISQIISEAVSTGKEVKKTFQILCWQMRK